MTNEWGIERWLRRRNNIRERERYHQESTKEGGHSLEKLKEKLKPLEENVIFQNLNQEKIINF